MSDAVAQLFLEPRDQIARNGFSDARQIKGAIARPRLTLDMGLEYGAVIIEGRTAAG